MNEVNKLLKSKQDLNAEKNKKYEVEAICNSKSYAKKVAD